MQLLIVRHAPAEELSGAHTSDADRELTPKGRRLFREFAQRMIKPDQAPQRVLYSPLIRCVQTAEILADVIGLPKSHLQAESRLRPGMSASQLAAATQAFSDERLAVVGHNPDVSHCTSQLIGGGSIEFKKGSMACLEFFTAISPGLGRLVWFLSPKLIVED